jgi:hypothetical protein
MRRLNWTERRIALQVVLAAGLALAACGGNDTSDDTSTEAGSAERAEALAAETEAANADLLPLVNPFIGTKIGNPDGDQGTGGAVGNTFPGATLPFGMVQFSPDTGYGEFYGFGRHGLLYPAGHLVPAHRRQRQPVTRHAPEQLPGALLPRQ